LTLTTGAALVALVVFVMPGFVALRFIELTHEQTQEATPLERTLQAVYFSVWVYSVLGFGLSLFWLTPWSSHPRTDLDRFAKGHGPLWIYGIVFVLVLILIPVLVAAVRALWLRSALRGRALQLRINPHHRVPSAWDHFFSRQSSALVRLTLADRRVVGGEYSSESFASCLADGGDLYLERRWSIDNETGWFTGPAESTQGLWIPGSSIVSVEFYDFDDQQPAATDKSRAGPVIYSLNELLPPKTTRT
jgi:hypothetical protein